MTTAASPTAPIETHFGTLKDPRAAYRIEHKLIDILILTICATICGANDWEAIAEYGQTKQDWLKTWLELPNGIPSPDTFSRVFARIKPAELQKCFIGWMEAVVEVTAGELLNIDGKTLRGAKEAGNSKSLIHMVSVWSASQHLLLGQQKVSEKSNAITAIPALLEMLAIRGCLVSIADAIAPRFPRRALHQADAMGCQTEIAKVIIAQGADYVLALNGNQGNLHADVAQLFTAARQQNFRNIEHQFHSTVEKGHGRIETRRYWTMGDIEYLIGAHKWSGLNSIGMVESERELNGKVSIAHRYYLLSFGSDVHRFATAVSSHWSIENQLHWILDVGFAENTAHSYQGYSAENLAVIRHVGINLLSRDKKTQVGVKTKRLKARWDDNYLKAVLGALNIVTS